MANPDSNSLPLSAESLALIDAEVAKYPADQKQSAVMAALRIAQTERGWLKPETHRIRRRLSGHAGDRGV